jgi:hypothetical protein
MQKVSAEVNPALYILARGGVPRKCQGSGNGDSERCRDQSSRPGFSQPFGLEKKRGCEKRRKDGADRGYRRRGRIGA